MSNVTDSYNPDTDDTAGVPLDLTDDTSARARSQRRLLQARSAMSDATARARQSAFTTRRNAKSDDEQTADGTKTVSTITDRLAAYRTYIVGAVAALLALVAVARKGRSSTPQTKDSVDLGEWHLSAETVVE